MKLFQKQIQAYHDKERIWKGVSNFWVIQNNQPVIDRISKINAKKKAVTIRTFDFSTLYTCFFSYKKLQFWAQALSFLENL